MDKDTFIYPKIFELLDDQIEEVVLNSRSQQFWLKPTDNYPHIEDIADVAFSLDEFTSYWR